MENNLTVMSSDDNWRTQNFRQAVVTKIEEVIQRSGLQVIRTSSEMENHVFTKAKTREEYLIMVSKLILHVREMSQLNQNQANPPTLQGQIQNQAGPTSQVQRQPGDTQKDSNNQSGVTTDSIITLQNLTLHG